MLGPRLDLPVFTVSVPIPGFRLVSQSADVISFAVPFGPSGPVQVQPQVPIEVLITELDLGKSGGQSLGLATNLPLENTIGDIGAAVQNVMTQLEGYCN
jgi:hypothetical protein